MSKVNVVDLGAFKELKELRRSVESFEKYLKTLSNSQLETEVNYLLDEFSNDNHGKDFFSKSQLILKEIKNRAHKFVKPKIKLLDNELCE
ncbi:MAG: hypothetical protein ACJ76H_03215 [Bacteriovoracaceae bacterium]